jgi:hypothetical protein
VVPFKEVRRKKWKVTPRAAHVLLLPQRSWKKPPAVYFCLLEPIFLSGHHSPARMRPNTHRIKARFPLRIYHFSLAAVNKKIINPPLWVYQITYIEMPKNRQFMVFLTQNKIQKHCISSAAPASFGGPIKKRTHKHCARKIPPNLWRSIIMNTENTNRRKKVAARSPTTKRRGILGRRRQNPNRESATFVRRYTTSSKINFSLEYTRWNIKKSVGESLWVAARLAAAS